MTPTPPRRVLLTVSGTIDPGLTHEVEQGRRPRPDYVALAEALGADIVDLAEARRRAKQLGRLIERVAGRFCLIAWVCFRSRRRYDVVLTDGEQVGLPLALLARITLRRRQPHVMIVHILSVGKKVLLYRLFRLGRYIDTMVVYSSEQRRFIVDELHVPPERVQLTTFMVDTHFFSPDQVVARPSTMICTAGLEFRDYPTLIEAARELDVRVVIAAASPWSKRDDTTRGADLPTNVEVCRLDLVELRQLYADARFVVMPLRDVDFQAGVTTILEAMAMAKPVVCTRTAGQTDVVVDGVNGLYVPAGDPEALRAAIAELLNDPVRTEALGAAARAYVEADCDVDVYARRLASIVACVRSPSTGRSLIGRAGTPPTIV